MNLYYMQKINKSYLIWLVYLFFIVMFFTYESQCIETFSLIENTKINYYVIHMKNSEERKANIEQNKKLLNQDIEIFEAIDGKSIPNKKELTQFHPELNNEFKEDHIGEIGCYLSHFMLIKQISEDKTIINGYSVIFEDDFKILDDDLHNKVIQVITDMELRDFDIIYLGNLWVNNHGTKIKNNIYEVDKNVGLWGLHGYLIKNKNADKIVKSLLHMKLAVDNMIRMLLETNTLTVYMLFPILVDQTGQKSTIR